jgi:hypothetical protein
MGYMRQRVTFGCCIKVIILLALAMILTHISVAKLGMFVGRTLLAHNIILRIRAVRHLYVLRANLPTIVAIIVKRVWISGFLGVEISIHARTVHNAWIVITFMRITLLRTRGIALQRTRVVSLITHRIFCGCFEGLTLVIISKIFIVGRFLALNNLISGNFINFF